MNLFLYPEEPTSWSVTPQAFAMALRTRWPSAQVRFIDDTSDVEALTFDLSGQEGTVFGSLSRTGQILILEYGFPRDLAEMIVWFRAMAPEAENFIVLGDSGVPHARVTAKTDVDQVERRIVDRSLG